MYSSKKRVIVTHLLIFLKYLKDMIFMHFQKNDVLLLIDLF